MSESSADIQREIDASRERISDTVAELDARVSRRVDAVKERLDVVQLIRDHPWPALAVALSAGLTLGMSGADAKAARATAAAAKNASRASVDAVKKATGKLRRKAGDTADDDFDDDWAEPADANPGLVERLGTRLFDVVSAPFAASMDTVLEEMRVASRDIGARMGGRATGDAN